MAFTINPPVLGHRGACGYAPENTLASFLKAKSLGVNWVEFDVMLSSDGEAVIIHDETVDRTTNGKGKVIDLTYSYLKTLDAGHGEKIPTLREVIDFLHTNGMSANIELKAQVGFEEQTIKKVLSDLDHYWKKEMPAPLMSSFSLTLLDCLRTHSSSCLIGYLMDSWQEDWKKNCDRLHCISVNVNQNILDSEKIQVIKSTDRRLLSYTVNEADRARELFDMGVDAVFSDFPDKILKVLK